MKRNISSFQELKDEHYNNSNKHKQEKYSLSVTESTLKIAKELKNLASQCIGPFSKIQKLNFGSQQDHVLLTNSSKIYFDHIKLPRSPIFRVFSVSVNSHLKQFQDGGFSMLLLSSSIVEKSIELNRKYKIPLSLIMRIIDEFQNYFNKILDPESRYCNSIEKFFNNVSISDMETCLMIVQTILSSNSILNLNEETKRYLAIIIVQSFIQSVSDGELSNIEFGINVRFHHIPGPKISKSEFLNGVIIDQEFPTEFKIKGIRKIEDKSIVIYQDIVDWDPKKTQNLKVNYSSSIQNNQIRNSIFYEFIDQLKQNNIQIVASQKYINSKIKTMLFKENIIYIERLSIRHTESIQRLTRTRMIPSIFDSIQESMIGNVELIKEIEFEKKTYLFFQGDQVSTIVLQTPHNYIGKELEHLCKQSMKRLYSLLRYPWIVPGGGYFEFILVKELKNRLTQSIQQQQHQLQTQLIKRNQQSRIKSRSNFYKRNLCIEMLIECMIEKIKLIVPPKEKQNEEEEGLFNFQFNWNDNFTQESLWDSLSVKQGILENSFSCANTVLRIDGGIIHDTQM